MFFAGLPLFALAQSKEKLPDPGAYLVPLDNYSKAGKALAARYQPELISMAVRTNRELKSGRFQLLDANHSPSAGVGFYLDPRTNSDESRYLGMVARVNVKLTYWPDNDWGRLGDALDAFGKDLLKVLGSGLDNVHDRSIEGAMLVLIYSKADLDDPDYYNQAEAMVIFIPRDVLKNFNSYRLTFNQMFFKSDVYYFQSAEQIQVLTDVFLRG